MIRSSDKALRTRSRSPPTQTMSIIIDGIPSLLSEPLIARSTLRVFVQCDEGERRRRFEREYSWRGASKTDIDLMYEARNQDEAPLVLAAAARANFVLGAE